MIVVAVGIGATTAAFTLLDQVLLRPLPFPHGEHLAMLFQSHLAKWLCAHGYFSGKFSRLAGNEQELRIHGML